MTILHANTDPDLLTRLRQMLGSAARADIAVGYFFMSGFGEVADDLAKLNKTRILVGRADQPTLEAVAAGLHQADALRSQLEAERTVQRSQRDEIAREATSGIGQGIAAMPQTDANQAAVEKLRQLVASGLLEVRAYPRGFLHAKAYLCWYDDHAEPGSAIVGSSNFTLAGFTGNTELNVRVTGDEEMATLKDWFEDLWADSVDISIHVEQSLTVSWAVKQYTPYAVYLKALYELYGKDLGSDEPLPLEPARQVELANFQLDAVRRGLDMIRSYGGCYVADVVGLGKTYIGAELLRQLRQSYPKRRAAADHLSSWIGRKPGDGSTSSTAWALRYCRRAASHLHRTWCLTAKPSSTRKSPAATTASICPRSTVTGGRYWWTRRTTSATK